MTETPAILIVDDDPQLCRTLSDILRIKGYAPVTVHTGHAALEQAAALGESLAVALVDLRLPDVDGLAVVAGIQRQAPAAEAIVLTGHASLESAVAALRGETFDYLQKPAPPNLLLATIGRALERRARKQAEAAQRASEARFRVLVDTATDAIITIGADERIRLFNRAAERIFGYAAGEVIGQNIEILIPEEYGHRHKAAIRRYLETGQSTILGRTVEMKGLRKGGEACPERSRRVFPLELSLSEVRVGGEVTFTAIIRDITERMRGEAEASKRADQMALVHDLGQQITPLLDVDELLQTAAEALHARFGYLSVQLYLLDQAAGDPSTDSELALSAVKGRVLEARGVAGQVGLADRGYRQPVGQGIVGRAAERGEEVLVGDVSREPDFIPCVPGIRSELALPIRVAGAVAGVLNVESEQLDAFDEADVIALKALAGQIGVALENARLYEETRRLSVTDDLTGLANRHAFNARLAEETHRARRYERPLSLIMADIDHFKHYNDTHGHPQGDVLLRELAGVLRSAVRETDFVARYGGEEFVVILPETDRTGALAVAEKVRAAVAAHPFPHCETQPGGRLTISLGVATFPEDLPRLVDLVELADQALYCAKRGGRDRVC